MEGRWAGDIRGVMKVRITVRAVGITGINLLFPVEVSQVYLYLLDVSTQY